MRSQRERMLSGEPYRADDPELMADRQTCQRLLEVFNVSPAGDARTRGGVTGVLKAYQKKDRLMAKARITSLDYDHGRNRVKPALDVEAGPKVSIKAIEAKVSARLVLKRGTPPFRKLAVK